MFLVLGGNNQEVIELPLAQERALGRLALSLGTEILPTGGFFRPHTKEQADERTGRSEVV